jgi:hypothetical protein
MAFGPARAIGPQPKRPSISLIIAMLSAHEIWRTIRAKSGLAKGGDGIAKKSKKRRG